MNIVKKGQTVFLVSAARKAGPGELRENLLELSELAAAAGLRPLKKFRQSLKRADPSWLIGEGKRKDLEESALQLKPDYIVFDHALSGVQIRNLEKALKIHVLDRSQLILEIFAQRAQSHEGKLQVELARLLDQMPRMTGAWLGSLSRQGGGGAARGPGEKALETDRRQARERIKRIRKKLEKVRSGRFQRRAARRKNKTPSFALIGCANSGKSALLNRLAKPSAKPHAEVKNQPFTTLDPKTKKFFIPGPSSEGMTAVVTDTVGFIRNLPVHLISAFKATLEESEAADVILHVIDTASPKRDRQIKVVESLIEDFGWQEKPVIYVFNKIDLLPADRDPFCGGGANATDVFNKTDLLPADRAGLSARRQNRAAISAKTGAGMAGLFLKMRKAIDGLPEDAELYFSKGEEHKIHQLARQAEIQSRQASEKGTVCMAKIPRRHLSRWRPYIAAAEQLTSC